MSPICCIFLKGILPYKHDKTCNVALINLIAMYIFFVSNRLSLQKHNVKLVVHIHQMYILAGNVLYLLLYRGIFSVYVK